MSLVRVKLDDGAEVTVAKTFAERHKLKPVEGPAVGHRGAALPPVPPADADEAEEAESPYDGLTVPDLKNRIEVRNAGRDAEAQIPTSGNKAALVAALVADDANTPVEDQ